MRSYWLFVISDWILIEIKIDGASRLRHSGRTLRRLKATAINLQSSVFNLQFLWLARPLLHQKSELRFDGLLFHVLRIRFGPLEEPANRVIARRQGIGHTNEFDAFGTGRHGLVVLVSALERAVAEVDGLVV